MPLSESLTESYTKVLENQVSDLTRDIYYLISLLSEDGEIDWENWSEGKLIKAHLAHSEQLADLKAKMSQDMSTDHERPPLQDDSQFPSPPVRITIPGSERDDYEKARVIRRWTKPHLRMPNLEQQKNPDTSENTSPRIFVTKFDPASPESVNDFLRSVFRQVGLM